MNDVMLPAPFAMSPWAQDADEDTEAESARTNVADLIKAVASPDPYAIGAYRAPEILDEYELVTAAIHQFLQQQATEEIDLVVCAAGFAEAIEAASKLADSSEAISALEGIWRQLDELCTKVEARFRLRLGSTGEPLPASPAWLREEMTKLRESAVHVHPPHPHAMQAAERLVAGVLGRLPEATTLRVCVTAAPFGRVEVEWLGGPELRWIVGPIALPWPGVLVRSYSASTGPSLRLQARTHHHAHNVIAEAVEVLGGDESQELR